MILSFEFISIVIGLTAFKLCDVSNTIISYLLKEVKIFLPLTKADCAGYSDLVKENKNKKVIATIRSCTVSEYLVRQDEQISNTQLNIIFFLFVLVANIALIFDNIMDIKTQLNLASSSSMILFSYLIGKMLLDWKNSKSNFSTYERNNFFLIQFTFFIVLSLVVWFSGSLGAPQIVSLHYDAACDSFNDRILKIVNFVPAQYKAYFHIGCSPLRIKLGLVFIFSTLAAFLFRHISRISWFDYQINGREDKYETIKYIYKSILTNEGKPAKFLSEFTFRNLTGVLKFRAIIELIIFVLLIDYISYAELKSIFNVPELHYYLGVGLLILLDSTISLICLRYYSILLFNSNYAELQSFTPSQDEYRLAVHKATLESNNNYFWGIFDTFFLTALLPLITYISFFNRSSIIEEISSNPEFAFKKYFLELIYYIILVSIYFAKTCVGFLYSFYLHNISESRNVLV